MKKIVQEDTNANTSSIEAPRASRMQPVVFISHDSRDADLAESFGNLLTDISGGILKPFCSSDKKGTRGIEFGEEWFKTIMGKLNDATDVVALLTPYSIDRPWILYEAGVAKGKLEATVFGVSIGIPLEKASSGPFAQFQNCADDEDSLTKLAIQLIKRNPDASPREEAVRKHVADFRLSITELLKKRKKAGSGDDNEKVDETTIAKLFEEVKVMFRALPGNVEEKLSQSMRRGSSRRERELHPMMLFDFMFHPMFNENLQNLGINWLMFISIYRDELPWFYELGMEFYNALKNQDQELIINSARKIRISFELWSNSPLSEISMGSEDNRNLRILRHQLPEIMDKYINRFEPIRMHRTRPSKNESSK